LSAQVLQLVFMQPWCSAINVMMTDLWQEIMTSKTLGKESGAAVE
jgi:hypothetical protein